jgi:hypothetical protein
VGKILDRISGIGSAALPDRWKTEASIGEIQSHRPFAVNFRQHPA